jgi:hypothetical protein
MLGQLSGMVYSSVVETTNKGRKTKDEAVVAKNRAASVTYITFAPIRGTTRESDDHEPSQKPDFVLRPLSFVCP